MVLGGVLNALAAVVVFEEEDICLSARVVMLNLFKNFLATT
jgi:hypothetical protein